MNPNAGMPRERFVGACLERGAGLECVQVRTVSLGSLSGRYGMVVRLQCYPGQAGGLCDGWRSDGEGGWVEGEMDR